ncbi:MAG: carboxypeptidase regulatory-like domain-containing protein [Parahaliea sp.]
MDAQTASGSWTYVSTQSVFLTGRLADLLASYQGQMAAVGESLAEARIFLSSAVTDINNLSADFFVPCTALSSLSASNTVGELSELADAILDGQSASGSWEDDVYSTAICLRALLQYEAGSQGVMLSSVSGRAVVSGSAKPLAGVSVSSTSNPEFSAVTNALGQFSLSGLSDSLLNLAFTKPGYLTTIRSVSLSGGLLALGDIPLAEDDGALRVQGRVRDAKTGATLANARVSLSGPQSYSTVVDAAGEFALSGVVAGNYQLTVSAAGYYDTSSQLQLSIGNNYDYQVRLVSLSTVLDDTPAVISGRIIDGGTGLPLSGVAVTLQGSGSTTSSVGGLFNFDAVARGEHTINLQMPGYGSATYRFTFPAGSAGELGDIALYASSSQLAAETVTLTVAVRDAVTGLPISGAILTQGTATVSTNAAGVAVLADIASTSFTVNGSAHGYHAQTAQVTVSGYGDVSISLKLTPDSEEPVTVNRLSGVVKDTSGTPLEGVVLDVDGAGLGVQSDSAGQYVINDIANLSFDLTAAKAGYKPFSQAISVDTFGSYTLDIALEEVGTEGWQIYYVNAPTGALGAQADGTFTASVQNTASEASSAILRGRVFKPDGTKVSDILPIVPGVTSGADALVSFSAGEVLVVSFPFNTGTLSPGTYLIKVDVVEPGTLSADLPDGVVYASSAAELSIQSTLGLSGDLSFDPPLSQAGTQVPIALDVLLVNSGNDMLPASSYTLTISNEVGDVLVNETADGEELNAGDVSMMLFGEWMPTEAGHLTVQVVNDNYPDIGEILGTYYVGDVATASFTLDQYVFPEGDQQTGASINVRGIDTTQTASSDPLFERAIEAVRIAGEYVGPQSVSWSKQNRCLGCHVQTQALVGMASSMPYTDIDEEQALFLYNMIASSQQNDGALRTSDGRYINEQQALGAWALVEWPDRESAHRVKLRALKKLWSLRFSGSAGIGWDKKTAVGWIGNNNCCEPTTAIATRAIVDFLLSESALAEVSMADFLEESSFSLSNLRQSPWGVDQKGDTLFIAKTGMIEEYNLQGNTSEIAFLAGSNEQFYDVAVDDDGTMYVTSRRSILKILPDGTTNRVYLNAYWLKDIVFWGDDLFATDITSHKIWRITRNLEASVFLEGGALKEPNGLAVSADGELIVANGGGYNLLAINQQGEVSTFRDGFSYPPFQVAFAGDGESAWVSTKQFYSRATHTYPTLQFVGVDGRIEPIFTNRTGQQWGIHSVAEQDGTIYFINTNMNTLHKVVTAELDRSFVDTLRSALPRISLYLLRNHRQNSAEVVQIAFRLMGLAEIKKVSTDAALLDEIEAAIDYMDQLLRSRQNSDGGWGLFSDSLESDALVTAWVGYALDYTEPSASDPMVRSAITYLLNTQDGDGSWSSTYFSTRYAATSVVMAYLPRALNRLGSLDVNVELTLPSSIAMNSPSIAPASTEVLGNDSIHYIWELIGVTGSGRAIDMDFDLIDLVLGEQRPAAELAELHFTNSYTGEELVSSIDIPVVTVESELVLTTDTDKPRYIANEDVAVATVLINSGPDFSNGRLKVQIQSALGTVVQTIDTRVVMSLPESETLSITSDWNTALYPAGNYRAYAWVEDSEGNTRADATAAFEILPSDGQKEVLDSEAYNSAISTDKQSYTPYQTVQLSSKVINEALNATQAPVLAALRVTSPSGEVVFSKNIVINQMAASAVNSYFDDVLLNDAQPGLYYASITVWDAPVQVELTSSDTMFTVIEQPLAHLVGEVSVDQSTVYRGQPVTCSEEVTNKSESVEVDAELIYSLVSIDEESKITVVTEEHAFTPLATYATQHEHSTASLVPGGYACVLQSRIDEEVTTLDFASFTVEIQSVDYEVGLSGRGRLLILLDSATAPGANGTRDISSLAGQDSYLRALLDAAGFSYTIVFTADDFKREFYSSQYHSYALMSEKVGLDNAVEYQLGEAVNAGAGLYIAGAFNRRNNHLEKVLGIESKGREQKADGVLIPAGALGPDWPETIVDPHTKLDFERCGANVLGAYINPKKGTATDDPACYNLTDTDAAAVAYLYGKGRAVYVGFDTLDEATLQGGSNPYSAIMLHALDYIQPAELALRSGSVIPLAVTLNSYEEAVLIDVLFDLPANLGPLDQIPGMLELDAEEGIWRWRAALGQEDEQTALFYVQMLDGNDATVDITLQMQVGEDTVEVGTGQIQLSTEPARDYLSDARMMLSALVMNYPGEKTFTRALADVEDALQSVADNNAQAVVDALLDAALELAESEVFEAQEARVLIDIAMLDWLRAVQP